MKDLDRILQQDPNRIPHVAANNLVAVVLLVWSNNFFLFCRTESEVNYLVPSGEPYLGNAMLPVFLWKKKALDARHIVEILLTEFEQTLLCMTPPVNIAHNVAFIVDGTKLKKFDDVKCDSMGAWKHSGTPKRTFAIRKDPDGRVEQVAPYASNSKDDCAEIFTLKRMYYVNLSYPDVRKTISVLEGT